MKDPAFKAFLKYKNHPIILQIRKARKNCVFCFEKVTVEEIEKEIHKFSRKRTFQNGNIPTIIIKENSDIFADADVQITDLSQFRSNHRTCSIKKLHLKIS